MPELVISVKSRWACSGVLWWAFTFFCFCFSFALMIKASISSKTFDNLSPTPSALFGDLFDNLSPTFGIVGDVALSCSSGQIRANGEIFFLARKTTIWERIFEPPRRFRRAEAGATTGARGAKKG